MPGFIELGKKSARALQTEGPAGLARRTGGYLRKKLKGKKRNDFLAYKDVLFIDGCGAALPHCSRYRVFHQMEQLAGQGITSDAVYYQELDFRQVRQYGVFLFFRCPWTPEIDAFIKKAEEYKKTVLYDIDDLVFDTVYTDTIPYVQNLPLEEKKAYDENVRQMGRLLELCQGAVTTTEALAGELKKRVGEVFINRNRASEEMAALSETARQKRTAVPKTDKVRLGYLSGSVTHNADMEMLSPVLEEIMETYPKTELLLAGELALPEALLKFQGRIQRLPFSDWRDLPEILSGIDINLAPLTKSIFNEAKSENKWTEASLVETVTAASKIGAFSHSITDKEDGFLCGTREEWLECLKNLIENPELRREAGKRAQRVCRETYLTLRSGYPLAEFIRKKRKKSAAFLLPSLNISGGIMVALCHARILRKAGYDVTLLTDHMEQEICEFQGEEFPVLPLDLEQIQGRFDRMTATMWVTVDFLKKYWNVKEKFYLVQNYETDFYRTGSMYRTEANATYGVQSGIRYITISKWCVRWLKEEFFVHAAYAPNGLDTERFFPVKREQEGRIRILIEGDCGAEHKNVDESFRIVEKLSPEKYEIWYLSYQSEPKSWYRVDRFFHKVPYERVAEIYQQCHILLKSSILESFSYPPLEMMATGGIAVVRPNEGNEEYLVHEENCLLYQPGNLQDGAFCIQRAVQDKALRERLIKGGLRTARERDWNRLQKQILDLYKTEDGA